MARDARLGLRSSISPNVRLQRLWHPWTSYLVVPLFALANTGIPLSGRFLVHAATLPIAIGIVVAGVVGKPLGVIVSTRIAAGATGGRLQPPVGWLALAAGGTVSGIGFTVSLLIASLVFTGVELEDAKVGILAAALASSVITWTIFRAASRMPAVLKAHALLGPTDALVDLALPVDPARDRIRGSERGAITVVEYGDFQCPICGRAEAVFRVFSRSSMTSASSGGTSPSSACIRRLGWRQRQLRPQASRTHSGDADLLLQDQHALERGDLIRHAEELGLDVDRFRRDLALHVGSSRISEDIESADQSGVVGTPTIFIDGKLHRGRFDVETLSDLVQEARIRNLAKEGRSSRLRTHRPFTERSTG